MQVGGVVVGDRRIDGLVTRWQVADEDISDAIRIASREVRRGCTEDGKASVAAQGGSEGAAVGLRIVVPDARSLGRARLAIVHKQVVAAVCVAGDKIGGGRCESDNTTVRADRPA